MNKTLSLLLAGALLAAPLHALAWGAQGHRLVAEIAERELTPGARAQVAQLLAGEPDPTLAGVASWADELRRDDPDLGKRTARWHFINIGESGCNYDPPRDCPDGNCVVEALKTQAALLADRSQPLAVRRQALKFVVHFVGDIHQPMHTGYAHDRGGNDYQVQFDGRGTNLHAVWDSGMLYAQHLDDARYLQRLLALPAPAPDRGPALPPPAAQWAEASCRIATAPGVYPDGHVLPPDYAARERPVAEAQLRLAGERLAEVLNAALAAPAPESPPQEK